MDRRGFVGICSNDRWLSSGWRVQFGRQRTKCRSTTCRKGGGRALVAGRPLLRELGGNLPFTLARFAEDPDMVAEAKVAVVGRAAVLSPVRDVSFRGFVAGAGRSPRTFCAGGCGSPGKRRHHHAYDLWAQDRSVLAAPVSRCSRRTTTLYRALRSHAPRLLLVSGLLHSSVSWPVAPGRSETRRLCARRGRAASRFTPRSD